MVISWNTLKRSCKPVYLMIIAVSGAALISISMVASRCSHHFASNGLESMIYKQAILKEKLDSAAKRFDSLMHFRNLGTDLPTVFAITPTHKRFTQKADLTRLSQTFMHIPNFHWIVVEDADEKSSSVKNLLERKNIKFTLLAIKTQSKLLKEENDPHWIRHRGVDQRNLGLRWIRENIKDTTGVVYLADDDNTYDIELFEEMRFTKMVSVWPVALVGGLRWEGPVCVYGKVISFFTAWQPEREFPLDMAAFAINISLILKNPTVYINPDSKLGYLETDFLHSLGVRKEDLEPKANNCRKILVWHTQTVKPKLKQERRLKALGIASDPSIEI